MNEQHNNFPVDHLAARLKREAARMAEPFSESLHGRVMRRVSESRAQAAPPPTAARWPFAAIGLAAAAVAVALVVFHTQPPVPAVPAHKEIARADFGAVTDLIRKTTGPIQLTMNVSIEDQSFGHLDRDVKSFGQFVMNQLDNLPEAAPGTIH